MDILAETQEPNSSVIDVGRAFQNFAAIYSILRLSEI